MEYQFDKSCIDLTPIETQLCSDCEKPATHFLSIDLGFQVSSLGDLAYCEDCGKEVLERWREQLPDTWQPIETAPKGKEVLVLKGNGKYTIADWGLFCEYNGGNFTHWMPLPEPPVSSNVSVALTGVSAKAEVGSVLATRNYNTDTWNNKVSCANCGNPADFEEHARGQAAQFHRFNPAPLPDPPKTNV